MTTQVPNRDVREVIREEPVMRGRILAALADGPLTVPQIAAAIGAPTHEVVFWVMRMRRFGWLACLAAVTRSNERVLSLCYGRRWRAARPGWGR